jgi:isopenicillin N synthase-like dioxygenase
MARDVLATPPRDCTASEIPIIDLSPLYSSSLSDRLALAAEIRTAAVNTGFFYVKNHGIEEKVIEDAKRQLLSFFRQSREEKMRITQDKSRFFNGWKGLRETIVNNGEGIDSKESVSISPMLSRSARLVVDVGKIDGLAIFP